jgi:hypothetical protein
MKNSEEMLAIIDLDVEGTHKLCAVRILVCITPKKICINISPLSSCCLKCKGESKKI